MKASRFHEGVTVECLNQRRVSTPEATAECTGSKIEAGLWLGDGRRAMGSPAIASL